MRVLINIKEDNLKELQKCGIPFAVKGTEKDTLLYNLFNVEDIEVRMRETLNKDQLGLLNDEAERADEFIKKVILYATDHFDANYGINWDTLRYFLALLPK